MSVDGPPGFQLLRLGFLRIAIQSSEALGPRVQPQPDHDRLLIDVGEPLVRFA